MNQIRKTPLDKICWILIGTSSAIFGTILLCWDMIIRSITLVKGEPLFKGHGTMPEYRRQEKKKAIRAMIGVALQIIGIVILAYIAITAK